MVTKDAMSVITGSQQNAVRRIKYNGETHYSLLDVVSLSLEDKTQVVKEWQRIKNRLKREGFDGWEKIVKIKLPDKLGRMRAMDCADAETCFRIMMSLDTPSAESYRMFLAQQAKTYVGHSADPEQGVLDMFDRARATYKQWGKDDDWIEDRFDVTDFTRRTLEIMRPYLGEELSNEELSNWLNIHVFGRDNDQLREETGYVNPRDGMTWRGLHSIEVALMGVRVALEHGVGSGKYTVKESLARLENIFAKARQEGQYFAPFEWPNPITRENELIDQATGKVLPAPDADKLPKSTG